MLLLGRQNARTCLSLSRRAFLQIGGSAVLGLSSADLLKQQASGSFPGGLPGKAKSVVLLWLWGGPSQLDTFDPKPNAPLEYRGPFGTIPTRIPGVRFCELFPRIAAATGDISVMRSLHTSSNDHGVAGTIGLTGSSAGGTGLDGKPLPGTPRPATGSVVARGNQAIAGGKSPLPPFLVVGGKMHQGKKPIIGEGGGPLGARYDPFRLEYDPALGTRVPALQLSPDLTPERLGDRATLGRALDAVESEADQLTLAGKIDAYRSQAFGMLTSAKARAMFDLDAEKPTVRDRYGRTRFGQSCLLARRLVEHGVPFVQVNWSDHVEAEEDSGDGGWDHHYRNFQIMQDRHAMWLDQTVAAFLADLKDRGLLQSTLVLAYGEFGRSPKINDKAGREHHPGVFSALAFGGGIQGGRVIGESDAKADKPRDNPLTPADMCSTVHHAVGITSELSAGLGVATGGRVIEELFSS
jgi:Protein of unknown function (DUF1501)